MLSLRLLPLRSFAARASLILAVTLALVALDLTCRISAPPLAAALWPAGAREWPQGRWHAEDRGRIPMPEGTPAAHASSLLPMPPGHASSLIAFWFAGTRESAADVQIAASALDRRTQQWSPARFVVNADAVGRQLGSGVRRLGNPVAWLDARGRIHLFVVATGLGGWAAGRILHLQQSGEANSFDQLQFEPVRVLPLSWLWNISFLVRTAPLLLADGGMVLPVYFELGVKYPVALRFDAEGGFVGMVRISRRPNLLQPSLLTLGETRWLALMRNHAAAGRVAAARTDNAGTDWVDLPDLSLTNPNASIAGMGLHPGHMVLAHNSSVASRSVLDLSSSTDGLRWRLEHTLEHGGPGDEFSYPAMAWVDGKLWISYTDGRRRIAWQRFIYRPD